MAHRTSSAALRSSVALVVVASACLGGAVIAGGRTGTLVALVAGIAAALAVVALRRTLGQGDDASQVFPVPADVSDTLDAVTGLPHRRAIVDHLDGTLESAARCGDEVLFMFIDIDDFKPLNDLLGHRGGDELLRTVSERVRLTLGPDDVLGRCGGDEFAVVSRAYPDRTSVVALADAIAESVSHPVTIRGHVVTPTVSIGLALRGSESQSHMVMSNADLALSKARSTGRASARLFDHTMRHEADQRARIERGLRRAVESRSIAVEYQPRVSLHTGDIVSLEALARWPERPDVRTSQFVEIAETTGIVDELGDTVLNRACADIMRLNDTVRGGPVGVSVNVSMLQLRHPGLIDALAEAVHRHAVPADLLTLEITETFIAGDLVFASRALREIRDLGARVEIDDFGVGHTSFRNLSQLTIDGIKIDRSLMDGMVHHEPTAHIVRAMVNMAAALSIEATIEGVETMGELRAVQELGCDMAQGFLFSRPVPLELAIRLVDGWPALCPAASSLTGAMPLALTPRAI